MSILDKIFSRGNTNKVDDMSKQQDGQQNHNTPKGQINVSRSINIIGRHYRLESLKSIPMGSVILRPIDAGFVFDDSVLDMVVTLTSISPNIATYIPGLNLIDKESTRECFLRDCTLTENGQKFTYGIYFNNNICGFVFVNTPSYNSTSINFDNWTIDFCLFSIYEGQGMMSQVVARMLFFLKTELKVNKVYAIVDIKNTRCLSMLSKLPFDEQDKLMTDPISGNVAKLFYCPLNEINFQKG